MNKRNEVPSAGLTTAISRISPNTEKFPTAKTFCFEWLNHSNYSLRLMRDV